MPKFIPVLLIVGVSAAAASACSKDSSTPTATSTDTTSVVAAYSVSLDTNTFRDSATAEVGTTIPVRVVVLHDGLPLVAGEVTWTINSGNGSLASSTSTTDSLGYATASWTMGDTVGVNSVTAAVGGGYVTINATAVAGPATALTRITGDSIWLVGGASTILTAHAQDRFGNLAAGAHVTWSTTDGDLATTESTTGPSGNAEVSFTAPLAAGESTITATLEGKASIRFRVIVMSDATADLVSDRAIATLSHDDLEDAGRQRR